MKALKNFNPEEGKGELKRLYSHVSQLAEDVAQSDDIITPEDFEQLVKRHKAALKA